VIGQDPYKLTASYWTASKMCEIKH